MISVSDLFAYLSRPVFTEERAPLSAESLKGLVRILFLSLAIAFFLSGFIGGVLMLAMENVPENVNGTLAETDPLQLFFLGIILAPIFEEFIFRSWIGLPRSSLLGLPALMCVIAIIYAVVATDNFTVSLIVSFGLTALYILIVRRVSAMNEAERAAARHTLFPWVFWGSSAVFAMIHISNFDGGMTAAFATPILFIAILPQFVAGAIFGYVRMRVGLVAVMVFHAAYNAVLIGLAVLAISLSDGAAESGSAETGAALLSLPATVLLR